MSQSSAAAAASSSGRLPLARVAPATPFVWRNGGWITAAEFYGDVIAFARRLPAHRYVLNLCEDRYDFLVAFAAAMVAGQTSLLPPTRADGALRSLLARYPDSYSIASATCTFAEGKIIEVECGLAPPCADVPRVAADHVAAIAFSSGSTGVPTEHAKTWRTLWETGEEIAARFALTTATGAPAGITLIATVPPQHMYGLECSVVLPLAAGARLDGTRPLLPADVSAAVARVAADRAGGGAWLITTPLVLRALDVDEVPLPGLAGVVSATMPLDAVLATRLDTRWQAPVLEIYGCTEGGSLASRRTREGEAWTMLPGVRIALQGETVWVSDGHLHAPVPLSDLIDVESPERFRLLGRAAHVVKVGGKRTSLEALNQTLLSIAGVRDGAFFVPNDAEDGRVTAFVVAPSLAARDVLLALREHIDPAFLPRPLYLVGALPRNDVGKLTRAALERLAAELETRSPR